MGEDSNKKKDLITELGINLGKPEDVYAKMLKYVAESAGSNQKTAKVKVLNLIRKRKLQEHFADTPIFQFLNEDAGVLKVAPGGSDADVTDKAIVDLSVVALCSLVRKDLRDIEVPVAGVVTLNTGTVISEAYGDISKFDIQTTSFKTVDSGDKSKDIFTILKGVDNIIKGHPWDAEESEKSEKDLFEETVRATYGINGKVSVIMNTYTYLFAGGYDVIPNVGILKSVGGNKYSILKERAVTRKVTTENGQQEISGGFVLSDKSEDNSEDNSDQLLSFVGQKLVTVNLASEVGGTSVKGKECTVRTSEEIVNELLANVSSRRPLSFPNKLVEYTFGYQPISKKEFEGVFRRSSKAVSWEGYSEIIKADLTDILTSFLTQYLIKFEGVDTVEKVRAQRSFKEERVDINLSDIVTEILDYAANCLTNICVVKKYDKISGKKTGSVITDQKRGLVTNFQFMSCMPFGRDFISAYGGESSRDAFIADILNHCYGGSKGDMEGTKSLGSKTPDLSSPELKIYEVGYQYNKKLANGRPQFAYKALNSLIRRGKEPTVENTILGSSPSGETITLDTKGIYLEKNPVHFIFAGSRSGKGVMTMNILASQIYSRRAIFYLDRKPDMAVTFDELSGKKPRGQGMFVINGSSNDRELDKEQIFANDFLALSQNHPNIPDYAIKALLGKKDEETLDDAEIETFFNSGGGILADIIYYKAFLLVSGFFIAMWSDRTCPSAQKKAAFPEFYDGVTLIADEIRLFQEEGFSRLENLFSDTLPPYNGLDDEIGKLRSIMEDNASIEPDSKKKPKKLETRDLKQKFNITRMYIEGLFNVLGESVHYSEGLVSASFSLPKTSNVFLIGQNCEQTPMSYEFFNGDNMRRLTGNGGMNKGSLINWESPIFSLLHPAIHHRSGGFDAIIGFNSEYPQYLDQENPKSQAFGRLDDVARNFAYVPSFNTRMDSVRLQQRGSGQEANKLVFKRTANSSNLEVANSKDIIYFKPFLILNDCTPTYLTNRNCVLDQCKNMGIAQEEIISDNPFCESVPTARGGVYTFSGDRSGLGIDNRVGFKDYLFSMGLQTQEIEEALTVSGILMNRLVQEGFGYNGTWWDFLTDLRWEYQFTVEDICNAVKNVGTNPQWQTSVGVKKAFRGLTKVQDVLQEIGGSIQSNEEAQYMAEAEGTTISSYSAEQSMQLYDEIFGGYESSGGDLLSGNRPVISSTKLRVDPDEEQLEEQPSTNPFVSSGSIESGFTNGQGQDVFISSSEDSDGLDISGLSQRSQPDRPSDIPVGSRFPTYSQPKEQPAFNSQSIGHSAQNTQEFGQVSQPTKTVQTVEVPDDLRQKLSLLGMNPDSMSFENLTSFANITGATPPKMVERQIPQSEPVQSQSWNTGSVEDDLFEGDPDLGLSSEEATTQAREGTAEAPNPVWNQGLDDFEVSLYDSEVQDSVQEIPAGQPASWVDQSDSVPTQNTEPWSNQQEPVKPVKIIPFGVQAAYSSSSPKQTEEDAQKQRELDTEVDEFKEQQKQHFVSLYETAPTPEGKEAIAKAAELMGITLGAPEPEVKISVMQDGYYDSAYTDSIYIVPDDYLVTPEEPSSQEAQKISEDCQAFAEGYTPEDELKGYSKQENYTYTRDQNRPTYNAEELHAAYLQNIDSVVQYITNSVLEFGGGANSITKFVQRAETIHVTSGVGTQPKMFNYKLPPSLYTKMSPEMVAVLDSACVSEMFDYSALRLMKNLTLMRFSADVLQNNVLPCLGLQTLDIEYFFANWKKLDVFRISMFDGQKETFLTIRRDNIQIAMSSPELKKAFFQNDLEHRIGYAAYQNARNKKVLSLEKWKKYKERREQGGFFNTIEGIAGQAIHGTGAAIHEASSITTGAVSGFSLFGKKVGNLGQKVSQGLRNAQGTYRATEAQRKKLMERLEREKNRQS